MSRFVIVLDTETCPIDKEVEAVLPRNMLMYDKGWIVVDKKTWEIVRKRSFLVGDIFLGEKEKMRSAYYADKIPAYWEEVKKGNRKISSLYNIRKLMLADMAEFGIDEVYAHNARFDYGTLNATIKWVTGGRVRYYFPKGVKICDTLKMSRSVIKNMPTYRNFCEKNNYLTKNGQMRFTAEILYRFITKEADFVESHTALEDVLIEVEIAKYCYRQHKKMRKYLYEKK